MNSIDTNSTFVNILRASIQCIFFCSAVSFEGSHNIQPFEFVDWPKRCVLCTSAIDFRSQTISSSNNEQMGTMKNKIQSCLFEFEDHVRWEMFFRECH